MACDPQVLMDRAKCITCTIPKGMSWAVLIFLACTTLNKKMCVTPVAPVQTSIRLFGNVLGLKWDYGTNPGFGFAAYWGTSPGGPYPNQILIDDPTLRQFNTQPFAMGTYYFVITAKNLASGCESVFSNEQHVTVFF